MGAIRSSAVAVVFRPAIADVELLLVRRASRRGDRWSGNLAFPGGLAQPEDDDSEATARREAEEEVGLRLGTSTGRLRTLLTAEPGRLRPMRVVPCVFLTDPEVEASPQTDELADAFWIGWRKLSAMPRVRVWKRIGRVPVRVRGIPLHGTLLWGLTFWMVEHMRRHPERVPGRR